MKQSKWHQRRLAKYFEEHYEKYEDIAEFWPDPYENQWLFDIPERGVRIELTCHDIGTKAGLIKEQRYKMPEYTKYVRAKLKQETKGFEAIYEDYILDVIGEEGFELLRYAGFLNTCGSVGGRTLYTLD